MANNNSNADQFLIDIKSVAYTKKWLKWFENEFFKTKSGETLKKNWIQ